MSLFWFVNCEQFYCIWFVDMMMRWRLKKDKNHFFLVYLHFVNYFEIYFDACQRQALIKLLILCSKWKWNHFAEQSDKMCSAPVNYIVEIETTEYELLFSTYISFASTLCGRLRIYFLSLFSFCFSSVLANHHKLFHPNNCAVRKRKATKNSFIFRGKGKKRSHQ